MAWRKIENKPSHEELVGYFYEQRLNTAQVARATGLSRKTITLLCIKYEIRQPTCSEAMQRMYSVFP